jgi:hypothetical protein
MTCMVNIKTREHALDVTTMEPGEAPITLRIAPFASSEFVVRETTDCSFRAVPDADYQASPIKFGIVPPVDGGFSILNTENEDVQSDT